MATKKSYKNYCCINECSNNIGTDNREIAMFKVPRNTELKQKWINSIKSFTSNLENVSAFLVCEKHFKNDQINRRKDRNLLKNDAIPTIFGEYSDR